MEHDGATLSQEFPGHDLVLLAAFVSRIEALVVVSMLEAAGIHVHAGGIHHASVSVNSLTLGGHRLRVPATQHVVASAILLEVFDEEEWGFSYGLRRAVLKFLGLWLGILGATMGVAFASAAVPLGFMLMVPFAVLSVPVNPQGRGDYFLAETA
jgi:hypothetical protein